MPITAGPRHRSLKKCKKTTILSIKNNRWCSLLHYGQCYRSGIEIWKREGHQGHQNKQQIAQGLQQEHSIFLPVLLKNDLWKVLLQHLIKNKVICRLLVYLVVFAGALIWGVTVGLSSTRPVTALKRNTMSRYSCQYVRGSKFNCISYPYMIVDSEMEDWGCILKLNAESTPSCKPVQSIEGPTLVFHTQVGTSHVK